MNPIILASSGITQSASLTSGVCFTFDDGRNMGLNWKAAFDELNVSYGWKATFYIYRYLSDVSQPLTADDITSIQYLHTNGCSIGSHTYMHYYQITDYMYNHSDRQYYEEHIKPLHEWLRTIGIYDDFNFAWPYGYENEIVANYLLNKGIFYSLRGFDAGDSDPNDVSLSESIWDGSSNRPGATWMDVEVVNKTDQYFLDLLAYCKQYNKIAILAGHNIVETPVGQQTSLDRLRLMSAYVKNNGMKFYTINDLFK